MARTRKQAGALNGNAAVTTQPGLAPVPVNGATYSSSTYPGTSYPATTYTVDYAEVAMIAGLGADAGIQRRPVGEVGWGMALRRFARATVWAIPAAMICLALAGVWGWPTADGSPSGASPGTWLLVTLGGLALGLIGVVALGALLAPTPAQRWAIVAVIAVTVGTLAVAPVLGLAGLARPAVAQSALGDAGPVLEAHLFDTGFIRWLLVGGFVALAVGWIAVGCAILASDVLNRFDGWLVLGGVAIAVAAAYLSWPFLLVLSAMVLLASGLGVAWTASRLAPDGRFPIDE